MLSPTGWLSSLGVMPPPSVLSSVTTAHTVSSGPITSTPHLDLMLPTSILQTSGISPPPITPPAYSFRSGMILSPASSPIPSCLVQRIQSGEFFEMRDLLADNVSLHTQLEDLHGTGSLTSTPVGFRPHLRA